MMGATKGSTLYRLMAAYWKAFGENDAALHRIAAARENTGEHAAARSAQIAISAELERVTAEICGFLPDNGFDARAKARFVEQIIDENGGFLEGDAATALASSVSHVVASDAEWRYHA